MRATFLMPRYERGPSGGFRVVCEHANQLVSRGHKVTIVHPRRLLPACPRDSLSIRTLLREQKTKLVDWLFRPSIDWQPIDPRVNFAFVPSSRPSYMPDADAIFATAWGTVQPVLNCPPSKGERCYLIQGYETWQGPKKAVEETWRAPVHKVVVSRWLLDVGRELGSADLTYIPNGIAHERYHLSQPIESRPMQVAMVYTNAEVKGPIDGIEAIKIAKARFPDLRVVMFGLGPRSPHIAGWIEYHRNPSQNFIVEEIYNRSAIFLSSSRSEGFALPPAEAACCGCAVVASDSGGIRDFVEHAKTGLLSPAKDPAALAKNLCLLLKNDAQRIELAKAGRLRLQQFSWKRSGDLLEDFLSSVTRLKLRTRFQKPEEEHCATQ